jgi:hypothetical protein
VAKRADGHADVAVEGPQPYVKCAEIGYEKHPEPGYERFLRIRPGQSIRDAKAEHDEKMKGMLY